MIRRIALGASLFLLLASCDDVRDAAGPAMTGTVTLTARADSFRVDLSWKTTGPAVDEYLLEGSLGDTGHFWPLATLDGNDSSWSDTTTTAALDRWYRITAFGASGSYTSSLVKSRPLVRPVPVGDTTTPLVDTLDGVPPQLRATADSFAIVLDWSLVGVPKVDGFVLERSLDDTLHFAEVARVPRQDTTWRDTSAKTAETRWYRIRLRDGAAASKPSGKVSATPLLPLVALEARLDGKKLGTLEVASGSTLEAVPLVNIGSVDLDVKSIESTRAWLTMSMDDSSIAAGGSRLLRLDLDTALIHSTGTRVATVTISTEQGAAAVFVVLVMEAVADTLEKPVLTLDSATSHQVWLGWSGSNGKSVEFAILQRKRAGDSDFVGIDTLRKASSARWKDNGLASRETVLYRMMVGDSRGDTALSNVVEAKTLPVNRLVVHLVDAQGQTVSGAEAVGPEGTLAGEAGTISLENIDSADTTYWEFRATGYLSRWILPEPPDSGSDTLTLVMLPPPSIVDLVQPEGTDFRGGVLANDTAWLVDGNASGSVLLAGYDVLGSPRAVRRILGQAILTGTPGMVARHGNFVATSFPVEGGVAVASVATNSVKNYGLPSGIGSPWGLGACPDGIAVAGSEGVGVMDSTGGIRDVRTLVSVVDDVTSSNGARVVCTNDMYYVADNGGENGLIRLDRGNDGEKKADLHGRTTARFLAADTSLVAVGTVGGGTHTVQFFDTDLGSKGVFELAAGTEIVALAMARDASGGAVAVVGLRRNGRGLLAFVAPSGHLRGSLDLDGVPVDLSSQGETVLVVFPDHASLVLPAAD